MTHQSHGNWSHYLGNSPATKDTRCKMVMCWYSGAPIMSSQRTVPRCDQATNRSVDAMMQHLNWPSSCSWPNPWCWNASRVDHDHHQWISWTLFASWDQWPLCQWLFSHHWDHDSPHQLDSTQSPEVNRTYVWFELLVCLIVGVVEWTTIQGNNTCEPFHVVDSSGSGHFSTETMTSNTKCPYSRVLWSDFGWSNLIF